MKRFWILLVFGLILGACGRDYRDYQTWDDSYDYDSTYTYNTANDAQNDSVEGTTWHVVCDETAGLDEQMMTFKSQGVVYTYYINAKYDLDGTWTQNGNKVIFDVNNKYLTYYGTIEQGTSMRGVATNITGFSFTFTAHKDDGQKGGY